MTSFAGFVKIFWNLEPHFAIRLKSSGRESIPLKRSFLDGERPIKPVRIARDLIKISITLTPLGQLAEHDPHRRHRFRRSYTPFGSLNISCNSHSRSASFPRATSASLPVSAKSGQTAWHMPHRMQTVNLYSSSCMSLVNVLMLDTNSLHNKFLSIIYGVFWNYQIASQLSSL